MKNTKPTDTTTAHLSQEQLLRYQADRMTAAEMHQAERHLLACALCSDALDGIATLKPQQTTAALADIKARLAHRLAEKKKSRAAAPSWWWAVAASIFLVVAAGIFVLFNALPDAKDRPLAQQEPAENKAGQVHKNSAEATPPPAANTAAGDTDKTAAAPQPNNQEQSQQTYSQDIAMVEDKAFDKIPQIPTPLEILEVPDEEEMAEIETLSKPAANKSSEAKQEAPKKINVDPATTLAGRAAGVSVSEQKAKESNRLIGGRVTDAATGEPLPGVGVQVKGSSRGTVTDINGEYVLQLPAAEATLSFSFIGYRQEIIAVNDKTTRVMASLEEDVESLSEVVITARTTQTKRDAASAVTSVSVAPKTLPTPAQGMRRFNRYLKQNLRYPAAAAQAGIEADVLVNFMVETDGSLSQLQVVDTYGNGLEEEAIRLLLEGPAWLPAKLEDGTPIRYESSVKIPFKLR